MRKFKYMSLLLVIGLFLNGCTSASNSESDLSFQEEVFITQENTEPEVAIDTTEQEQAPENNDNKPDTISVVETDYPAYTGQAFITVNDNVPFFTESDMTTKTYESYSPLDTLDRPGMAIACLGTETMPAEGEKRGEIGMVKPVGWHTVKYPEVISDLYLYNRCHLIGWQLSAENANELNLITGTRYLNVIGMLPFEDETADYIHSTKNHVLYRVTPIYTGDNLVCDGLLMEAQSVEDDGLSFCVYCYNVQPGIGIDYATGDSWLETDAPEENTIDTTAETDSSETVTQEKDYVLNTNSMKIHKPDCSSIEKMSEQNRKDFHGDINTLLSEGYSPCGICNPE